MSHSQKHAAVSASKSKKCHLADVADIHSMASRRLRLVQGLLSVKVEVHMMNQPPKEFTISLTNKDYTALYPSACPTASLKTTCNYNYNLYVRHVSISHSSFTSHMSIHLSWFHPVSQRIKMPKIFHACICLSLPSSSPSVHTHATCIPHAFIPIG